MNLKTLYRARQDVLTGTVVAIDPSSGSFDKKTKVQSYPGYAVFKAGVLVESGVIPVDGRTQDIFGRMRFIRAEFDRMWPDVVDVLAIEEIRGRMSHHYLKWAVGLSVGVIESTWTFEVPVQTWRKFAGKSHVKSDMNDAVAIGKTLIHMAEGLE